MAVVPAAIPIARLELPRWPDVWYVVARSADIGRGCVIDGSIANRPFVIFRSEASEIAALDAHCPHMGAHLRNGDVVGERLRCPLHHWVIDQDGRASGKGACASHRSRTWPVAERFGLVFLYAGNSAPPALPLLSGSETYAWVPAQPVLLNTDWRALMVNGFDVHHMQTVHQRAPLEAPQFSRTPQGGLRMDHTSRVMPGGGFASWLVKWIARDRIQFSLTSYGTTILLESRLGAIRSCAAFGFLPRGDKVCAYTSFGTVRRGAFWRLRLWLTRWCFVSFLRKDFKTVDGMKLVVDGVDDPGIRNLTAYLRMLPQLDAYDADG